MVNNFKPRFPNWCDIQLDSVNFNSFDELLEIEFIKTKLTNPKFKRLSISENMLMFEKTDGTYWVIGYIKHPEMLNLPKWKN